MLVLEFETYGRITSKIRIKGKITGKNRENIKFDHFFAFFKRIKTEAPLDDQVRRAARPEIVIRRPTICRALTGCALDVWVSVACSSSLSRCNDRQLQSREGESVFEIN